MKKIATVLLLIISGNVFAQNIPVSGFDTTTGRPGKKYTLKPLRFASPLFALNDSTAAIDTSKFTINTYTLNGTNDSIIVTMKSGLRFAAAVPSGGSSQWTTTGSDIGYSTGKVGVGTTAPSYHFHVKSNVNAADNIVIENLSTGASAQATLAILNDAGNYAQLALTGSNNSNQAYFNSNRPLYFYTTVPFPLKFGTNGIEAMRIDSATQNVGIGTTLPLYKLHLKNPSNVASAIVNESNSNGSSAQASFALINDAGHYGQMALTGSGSTSGAGANAAYFNSDVPINFYTTSSSLVKFGTNNTDRLTVSSAGAIQFNTYGSGTFTGTAVKNLQVTSGGDVIEGALTPTLASGTYTPTLTNTTNVSSSTAYVCQYMRVGSTVTVSGFVNITPTAGAAAATILNISLPIASNFTSAIQGTGTGAAGYGDDPCAVFADATNDNVKLTFRSTTTSATDYVFHFTYQIL